MITLVLENIHCGLTEGPDGSGVLAFRDPASEIQVQVPMDSRQRGMLVVLLQGRQITPVAAIPDELIRGAG